MNFCSIYFAEDYASVYKVWSFQIKLFQLFLLLAIIKSSRFAASFH